MKQFVINNMINVASMKWTNKISVGEKKCKFNGAIPKLSSGSSTSTLSAISENSVAEYPCSSAKKIDTVNTGSDTMKYTKW